MTPDTQLERISRGGASGAWPLAGIHSRPQSNGRTTRSVVTAASRRSHAWKNACSTIFMLYCAVHALHLRQAEAGHSKAGPPCRRLCAHELIDERRDTTLPAGSVNRAGIFFGDEA